MPVGKLHRAAVAITLVAAAAACTAEPTIAVSGTLLHDGEWRLLLDEASTQRFDSGEVDLDIGWRTSVRCTDGSNLTQGEVRAGWHIEVHARGFRGEHMPTLDADRVRVECALPPPSVAPDPSARELEEPEAAIHRLPVGTWARWLVASPRRYGSTRHLVPAHSTRVSTHDRSVHGLSRTVGGGPHTGDR